MIQYFDNTILKFASDILPVSVAEEQNIVVKYAISIKTIDITSKYCRYTKTRAQSCGIITCVGSGLG
jgi:hypothetical protein